MGHSSIKKWILFVISKLKKCCFIKKNKSKVIFAEEEGATSPALPTCDENLEELFKEQNLSGIVYRNKILDYSNFNAFLKYVGNLIVEKKNIIMIFF